jgi:glycosyltransferase involved in cell wall biosynthesis
MRIAILVAVLGERDAVGTDAREMAAALRRAGHDVRMFASASHGVGTPAEPLEAIVDVLDDPRALVIYHFAFGWPPGIELLRRARCRRIVRYHNVTPPAFFAGWSEEYEASCRLGRDEIATLAGLACELYLGDSPFNIDDLLAVGVPPARTAVLAPFNRIDRLVETPADLEFLRAIETRATTWLAVGRLAPNKGHLVLFDAFATYLDRCDADARLLVVGSEDARLADYNSALHERIAALRIGQHVHFLRDVPEPRLKAAYLSADALVSLSAHEGFCVPLVEAMALGVPVVARDAGAQATTLGGAGLVWDDPDAGLVAASIERLRGDAALRELLRERGTARVARAFTTDVLERGLAGVLERFA